MITDISADIHTLFGIIPQMLLSNTKITEAEYFAFEQ